MGMRPGAVVSWVVMVDLFRLMGSVQAAILTLMGRRYMCLYRLPGARPVRLHPSMYRNVRAGHGGQVYDGETSIWLLLTIPVHNREKVYTAVCLTAAST